MAQNITLLGASYSDVPAVTLPKTGGGTAKFTDVTPTTASASDVASGKIFFDSSGTQQTGTASGGGGGGIEITQDSQGYIVLPKNGGGGGGDITVEALSITQNGTYTAPTGKAYSPITVNVSGGGGGGTFGSINIKNNLPSTIKVWQWGVDNNGNTVANSGSLISIVSGDTVAIQMLWSRDSTTYVSGILRIQCDYASTATSATITGTSTALTYKIGTNSKYFYAFCAELSGTTVTVA